MNINISNMPFNEGKIRILSLLIIKKDNKVLVSPGYDKVKDNRFYRLIGGGVEFGETALEALQRELMEELNAELINIRFLNVIENIFTYNGERGHEISFIYEADFKDKLKYDAKKFQILDSHIDNFAVWVDINEKNVEMIKPEGSGKLILENIYNK
jgi:ADP-ribose pyrophosphatase YjhB (NUDIX family)